MDEASVLERIKEIIADVADLDVEEIGDRATFEELGLDSLALLEMGVDIDYEFKLGVGDDQLKELRSVPETLALVREHSGNALESRVA